MTWPKYAELPGHDARGVFGENDAIGSLNRLTPAVVQAASASIRSGRTLSLNMPINWPEPGLFGRNAPRHEVVELVPGTFDDSLHGFYPQGSSQWDGFRHTVDLEVGYYNGLEAEQVGVEHWAKRGIAGRGVLLDMPAHLARSGRSMEFDQRVEISVEDVEGCLRAQDVEPRDGDIVLLRTGWIEGYTATSQARREELAATVTWSAPGLSSGHDMAALLWDWGVAAIATDCPTLEAFPIEGEFLHHKLLGRLGIPIGELWALDALADACREDGHYDFFLTSAPIDVTGGVGSPANAIAIK